MFVNKMRLSLNFLFLLCLSTSAKCLEVDLNGYLMFCPCMGRFGNQMEQFLGVLAFAKGLNRTLVLPPLIEYRTGTARSIQVPFDTYFDVAAVPEYHRAVLMHDFMRELASDVWPNEARTSFCYMERNPITTDTNATPHSSCNAKQGNPFGPFWDEFNIDFVASEFFGPLTYDVHHRNSVDQWHKRYPASRFAVLAFSGAPASFPVQTENAVLQKYFKFNSKIQEQAKRFVQETMPKGAYIGIHLRNGIDWTKACQHVETSSNLFSSPQCLGARNEHGNLTQEMCMPPKELVIRQLKRHIKAYKEEHRDEVRAVFVASDKNHMVKEIEEALQRMQVAVVRSESSDPILDLAVLIQSNHFVGNCVSSFSAFVKRSRDARGLKSAFWAFPSDKKNRNRQPAASQVDHGEL